jgi:hypothetical protein
MNDAQVVMLAALLTFLTAEYAEASTVPDKEPSAHAPGHVTLGPHLDYTQPEMDTPPPPPIPTRDRQMFMRPIYEWWDAQDRAAQAAAQLTMRVSVCQVVRPRCSASTARSSASVAHRLVKSTPPVSAGQISDRGAR